MFFIEVYIYTSYKSEHINAVLLLIYKKISIDMFRFITFYEDCYEYWTVNAFHGLTVQLNLKTPLKCVKISFKLFWNV